MKKKEVIELINNALKEAEEGIKIGKEGLNKMEKSQQEMDNLTNEALEKYKDVLNKE